MQRLSDFECDGDAAAGEREHHDIGVVTIMLELLGESSACLRTIVESCHKIPSMNEQRGT
jgi:hypothetical protein